MNDRIYDYPEGLDHPADRASYDHLRTDTRCPYIHAMTEEQTTCPIILSLIEMKRRPSPFDQSETLRFRDPVIPYQLGPDGTCICDMCEPRDENDPY